jgi:hypothetical protein
MQDGVRTVRVRSRHLDAASQDRVSGTQGSAIRGLTISGAVGASVESCNCDEGLVDLVAEASGSTVSRAVGANVLRPTDNALSHVVILPRDLRSLGDVA